MFEFEIRGSGETIWNFFYILYQLDLALYIPDDHDISYTTDKYYFDISEPIKEYE